MTERPRRMRDLLKAIVYNHDMITDAVGRTPECNAATRPGALEKFKEFGANTEEVPDEKRR